MSDWPNSATRRSKALVFAEARRRGLMGPDGGAVWLYMFHDIHGVAHFRHVDHRGYMQMLPDDMVPSDMPANDTQSCDIPVDEMPADDMPADEAALSGSPDDDTSPVNDNRGKTGRGKTGKDRS